MINVAISESNHFFEYGLKKLLKSYFFYQNRKVNFSGYEDKFADEPWLIFRSLDAHIDSYGCNPFMREGRQRIIPICMPQDLACIELRPCIRDSIFFFRNDSVDTLLEKLDALWRPWPMNNNVRAVHECVPCGECRFQRLSYSEKKVIRYIGLGFTVSNISRMLQKNVKTISSQKRSAMRKLNMSRNIELYRFLTHSELM